MPTENLAVELKGLAKSFGPVIANSNVNLRVESGTIHGVIGENGAGKSTAMKMLYGLYPPDSGEIFVRGKFVHWKNPKDAIKAGIGMVHQHFMLAGPYTALDNILLGVEPTLHGAIDRNGARVKLEAISRQYGLPVDFDATVESLPVGIQQRIEILKLLYHQAEILILDEPTAVLTPQETVDLLSNLKKLKAEGKTIIIITHKLKEVMSFTDRVTVLRAGRVSGEVETSKTSVQQLADLMVGRQVNLNVQAGVGATSTPGKSVLKLDKFSTLKDGRPTLKAVTFEVHEGEIVGIAGVEGNGQGDLIDAIMKTDHHTLSSGVIEIAGQDVRKLTTARIRALGVGVIPQDRHHEGLLLERTVRDNFLLGLQRRKSFSKNGFIRRSALEKAATQAVKDYDVRPPRLDITVKGLSGGNQQKLIIAREFECRPRFLIAAQPTRGVDVGAIESIHRRLLRARDEKVGVLLISSELEEILTLSDRILIMYEGEIVGEFKRGAEAFDERQIGLKMGGAKSEAVL